MLFDRLSVVARCKARPDKMQSTHGRRCSPILLKSEQVKNARSQRDLFIPSTTGSQMIHRRDGKAKVRVCKPGTPNHELGQTITMRGLDWTNEAANPNNRRSDGSCPGATMQEKNFHMFENFTQ